MNVKIMLVFLTAACLALAGNAALGDKVILKDGSTLEGRVTEVDGFVYVQTAKPAPIRLERDNIQQIIPQDEPNLEPKEAPATEPAKEPAKEAGKETAKETPTSRPTLDSSAFPKSYLPEPIIYALMRRVQGATPGQETSHWRQLILTWQAAYHDGSIRSGDDWITGKELQRRRGQFQKDMDDAEKLLLDAQRLAQSARNTPNAPRITNYNSNYTNNYNNRRYRTQPFNFTQPQNTAQLQTANQELGQAQLKLRQAAMVWGDPLIRKFLLGQLALSQNSFLDAGQIFSECISEQPMVAAFYQGRALAYMKAGRALDALADAAQAMRLRDDQGLSYTLLEAAIKNTPGALIQEKAYLQAKAVLDAYTAPTRSNQTRKGTTWLMPGTPWLQADNSLTVPPCDYLVARKAVAVPVSADGVLLVDGKAIAGAAELLLEVGPKQYRRAEAIRQGSSAGGTPPPLAAIRVEGYSFTALAPVDPKNLPSLKGQSLTVYALSLPEELDALQARRKAAVAVTQVNADETLVLAPALRPGEGTAPLLSSDGKLVTFVTGRTDPTIDGGGNETVLPPADVAKLISQVAKSGDHSTGTHGNSNAAAYKAPVQAAAGEAFTLHILTCVGGTASGK